MDILKAKGALVTGAASGIGKAIATAFVEAGAGGCSAGAACSATASRRLVIWCMANVRLAWTERVG